MKYGFGIDLGGTTVKIAYFDETGTMLDKWEIPTVTENGGEQGFWPSYADMMSAVALILFFLMLISYIQNLITGNDLQNTQEVLEDTDGQLALVLIQNNGAMFLADVPLPGIAFLTVERGCRENDAIAVDNGIIDLFIKSYLTAVEVVYAVIAIKLISLAVEIEFTAADAVTYAADDSTEVAGGVHI